MQEALEEPLADASAIALWFLYREASGKVEAVISGEGADELFGGYPIYHEPYSLALYQKLPRRLRRVAAGIASCVPGHPKGKGFLHRGAKSLEERFIGNGNIFTVQEIQRLMLSSNSSLSPQNVTREVYERSGELDDISRMQLIDLCFWLWGDILLEADKLSMAYSVVSRFPYLDKRVYEVARRLPLYEKVASCGTMKAAFRDAAALHLSKEQAYRQKLGFPVPIGTWLRQEPFYGMVYETFTGNDAEKFFHTDRLVRMLERHRDRKEDYARRIWAVYVFLVWYQGAEF